MKNKEKNQGFFSPSIFPKTRQAIFLAEETLKIVLAVIVIGFLIYFLVSLYFANSADEDLKFAEESLNFLVQQMNAKVEEVQIYNPKGWSILSWPYADMKPASCTDLGWENCLCICENPVGYTFEGYLDNCEGTGDTAICVENSFVVIGGASQAPILIENPAVTLRIDYDNKRISKKQ
ncbi:hypothetical protein A3K62_00200 [Candidatus Pacearchaeota archaeon RBG_16_35_8]|nr:MAG: hypothetical protein A3K62_00200 [Candidatus Pacearchaeota archaeon RBG_16_35_8]